MGDNAERKLNDLSDAAYTGNPSVIIDDDSFSAPQSNVTTGGDDRNRFLYYQLKMSMQSAAGVDLIVSFLMESGVRLILNDLKVALAKGAKVRILTGNYLGITQPSALYLLRKELGDQIDLRFYNEKDRSFHAKSYIFHFRSHDEIFIGSSNVSKSALTSGIEWNFRFSSTSDPGDYRKFYSTFEDLFERHSIPINDEELKKYSEGWHRPAVYKDFDRYGDGSGIEQEVDEKSKLTEIFQPRGAQIEALYALDQSVNEGAGKALIQAATGVGKTYIAAFFSRPYKRILFVAHREEILNQASRSFHNVRPDCSQGFFTGDVKDTEQDIIFASVETLGNSKYLNDTYFKANAFDLIEIDEFHHAVTSRYRNIIEYFRPKFLLGMTATPERMDGRDIYELCDYNVPFELNLRDAINKGMLVPFHYYGIYDETDYSGFHLVKGRYTEEDLNKAYIGNSKRYDLIFKYYKKYPSVRALGFCSSRNHAEDMAREFCERGIKAAAVYSGETGTYSLPREDALEQLAEGTLNVIFSVDMFNEGVDLPAVDMVMFLRPTESPVVFLQQLGRGLRRARGKEYLNVLDFIGNYQRAGSAPVLLSGDGKAHGPATGEHVSKDAYPDDCIVDFDMRLIDLFKKMQEKSRGIEERIDQEFFRIQDELDHVPSRMELFTGMDDAIYTLCMAHRAKNPFPHYLEYLHRKHLLTIAEQRLYDGLGREFLDLISNTAMSRVYKMPVLYAFYNHGHPKMDITDEEALAAWKDFFNRGTNWKDLLIGKNASPEEISYERYQNLKDSWHLKKIHEMPIHFLLESGKGFFVKRDGYALSVREDLLEVFSSEAFARHFGDILDYRTMDYYRRRYIEKSSR